MKAKTMITMINIFLFIFIPPSVNAFHQVNTLVDILIDVGHGGIDGGASHGDILEKNKL